MARLRKIIHAVITSDEEGWYVAECHEIAAVTQGRTLDETVYNLREAVALFLEGENLSELGFAPDPVISIALEADATYPDA
jgi:predicted RNase H-like HicB family nuclease